METAKKRRAVFLDRDGTIIEDQHYPREADKVKLIERAAEALKLMHEKGYLLFVISNQSGVGRGIISDAQFKAVHQKTCEILKRSAIEIAEFAYCFHHPEDHCQCRKPKTGLVPKTFSGDEIDLKNSVMVGDRKSDLLLGKNFGGQSYLVLTGHGKKTQHEIDPEEFTVCEDIFEVAKKLPPTHPA